jgi:hypothetical protein
LAEEVPVLVEGAAAEGEDDDPPPQALRAIEVETAAASHTVLKLCMVTSCKFVKMPLCKAG